MAVLQQQLPKSALYDRARSGLEKSHVNRRGSSPQKARGRVLGKGSGREHSWKSHSLSGKKENRGVWRFPQSPGMASITYYKLTTWIDCSVACPVWHGLCSPALASNLGARASERKCSSRRP